MGPACQQVKIKEIQYKGILGYMKIQQSASGSKIVGYVENDV